MRTCYYYASDVNREFGNMNACSIASDQFPITVNCAGRIVANDPFVTDNAGGREDYYLIYVERGVLDIVLNGTSYAAQSGTVVLFPPHCHYKYTFSGNHPLSYLWAHFTGSYAKRFLEECGFGALPFLCDSDPNIKVTSGFETLFELFASHDPLQKRKLACRLEDILLCIASEANHTEKFRDLKKSLEHIHSFYNKDLKIPDLAKMENLSNSRYITVFKKHMGIPPSDYIINLRINVACDLLKNHDMSIKAIAACVGYDDPHFFCKLFKKKTGISPKSYREDILR